MFALATIAELEKTILAEAPETWTPQIEVVSDTGNADSNQPRAYATKVAEHIDQHRLHVSQTVAHLTILMDLYTAKATDLILSKNIPEAEEITQKVEIFCRKNLERAKENIKSVSKEARNTARFRNYSSLVILAFNKYESVNKKIISVSEGKLQQIAFLKEAIKDIRGKGCTTSAFDLYKNAIHLFSNKWLEPRTVQTDEEYGAMFTFDIPIPKEKRRDRQFKRNLEEKIHNAVRDANPEAVGKVGITWTVEETV
ncbi:hypothetical protein [Novacetimonas hansenii]|uniref:hypothetical protein n=1 Tax=Novacetimonas hansenii TaxID=436 RepID=UPI00111518F1|nr:hypothetical protein [Novacetimonas hansenii]